MVGIIVPRKSFTSSRSLAFTRHVTSRQQPYNIRSEKGKRGRACHHDIVYSRVKY